MPVDLAFDELAEYINTLSWNCPAFYNYDDDDDEDYTIAITPVLPTEEPDNSLSIPDNMYGVPFRDNSPPLDVSKDQFEEFSYSNDDSTSIDDNYFSIDNIDYVEASPPDSELAILKEVKDDILREKLLNIHLLVAKIEPLNDNPTPNRVLKSLSLFPIPVEDSDSLLESPILLSLIRIIPYPNSRLLAIIRKREVVVVTNKREKDKIETKPDKKQEAWRRPEKSRAVSVNKARKTEQNPKKWPKTYVQSKSY
nr:hypothetical protein [Tanacetum cinerariifolium]